MSRSSKKFPGGGWTTCASEKEDKRIWHGRYRSAVRQACHKLCGNLDWDALEDAQFPHVRELSDPWGMGKDGKSVSWKEMVPLKYLTTQPIGWHKPLWVAISRNGYENLEDAMRTWRLYRK